MSSDGMWHPDFDSNSVSGPPDALLDRRPPDYVDNGISLRKYLELAVNDPTKHHWAYECIFVVEEKKWRYSGDGGTKTVCDEVIFAHGWDLSEMIVNLNYYDFYTRRLIEAADARAYNPEKWETPAMQKYKEKRNIVLPIRKISKLTIDPNRIKKPWKICGLDKLHWSCLSKFHIPGISHFESYYESAKLAESQSKYNEFSI